MLFFLSNPISTIGKHDKMRLFNHVNRGIFIGSEKNFKPDCQRFREVIAVPDCLGEEAILIDIFTSKGYLKGKGMLISATPILGIMSSVGILALPFRPLYNKKSIILSPFLKGYPLQLSKDASHTPSFMYIISGHKPCRTILNLFQFFLKLIYIRVLN